jgi:AAA family ATP:ADP antiporter
MLQDSKYHSSEINITRWLGLALLGNAFAQKLSEIISVSSFFSNVGVNQIIWVWVIDGTLMLAVTSLQSLIIDRYSRRKIMEYMVIFIAMSFIFLQVIMTLNAPAWLSQSLLFLLSQQQWLTFPLIFWVFTNDLLGINQAKRLIPKIASWGFAGYALGISFIGFTSWLMQRLNLPHTWMITLCLIINIAIYGGIFSLLRGPLSHYKIRSVAQVSESIHEILIEGWDFVREVELFRYLVMAVLATVSCETIIDFRFFKASFAAFPDLYSYQMVQSIYLFFRAIIEGMISQFIAQPLIHRTGLRAVFFLQPMASLAATIFMVTIPSFVGSLAGIFSQKSAQYGIDEPARKALQALVPQERRGRVSNFIDGYMIGLGGILGALIIAMFTVVGSLAEIDLIDSNFYLIGALVAAMVALISTWKMYQTYNTSMLDWRLHRRKRGDSVLDNLDF